VNNVAKNCQSLNNKFQNTSGGILCSRCTCASDILELTSFLRAFTTWTPGNYIHVSTRFADDFCLFFIDDHWDESRSCKL